VERPSWAPADIDLSRPSPARIYDYLLGGTHHFPVDREAAEIAIAASPDIPYGARTNREFLGNAVRFMASQGITQFLDIGSGIPTAGNTHEVAAEMVPDARVVYVDNDVVAVAHSRALLAEHPYGAVVHADLCEPRRILGSPEVAKLLDLAEPVGLLLLAVLHLVADEDDPYSVVATLKEALAPGSYLAISHVTTTLGVDPRSLVRKGTPSTARLRSQPEIAAFFDGLEMVEPGLVPVPRWAPVPRWHTVVAEEAAYVPGLAGVARKP
jgi:hypothetical protein